MAIGRSMLGLLLSLFVPLACGTHEGPLPAPPGGGGHVDDALPTPTLVCPAHVSGAYPEMAPLDIVKAQTVGAIDGAVSVSSTGSARYSIPLTVPASRRTPAIGLVSDSHSGSGVLGKGFSFAGLRNGEPKFDDDDGQARFQRDPNLISSVATDFIVAMNHGILPLLLILCSLSIAWISGLQRRHFRRAMTHWIRPGLQFVCCLLLGLSSVGCAAPLSLEYLKSLNPSAYAGRICGVPKGVPANTRFYAINAAMHEIVTDRDPEALKHFMPLANSVHEVSTSAPFSSSRTVPISMAVSCPGRVEFPEDLKTTLQAVITQSCAARTSTIPERRFLAQTYEGPRSLDSLELELAATVLTWALTEAAAQEPRIARPSSRQMLPMPPVEWEVVPEADAPLRLGHPVVQFSSGAVAGAAIGAVPFGPMGADVAIELRLLPKGTYWARVGKACGEVGVGAGEIILGCAGASAGVGMSGTGVGAIAGIVVAADSLAVAGNGCLTAGHGLAELHQLWRDGDPATNVSAAGSGSPPRRLVLKKAAKQPSTPAPVAQAPAAKPTKAEAPPLGTVIVKESGGGTVTQTRQRAPAGKPPPETTTTITTNSTGSTRTTRVKGKPSAASADATPVVKGAKRGPKTDPAAPHNATVAREGQKLEAEGYRIVAGGRKAPEQLIETKGGIKSGRRPDVIGKKAGVPDRRINVGKTNADGTPVKREQEALDDLNQHGDPPTEFVPYDR